MRGANDIRAPSHILSRQFLTRLRFCFTRHVLGQPALLPRCRILMDDVLLPGAVEEFDGFGIGGFGFGAGGGTHPLERGTELTALGAVQRSPRASLTHSFGG